jgi:hypothetical protein
MLKTYSFSRRSLLLLIFGLLLAFFISAAQIVTAHATAIKVNAIEKSGLHQTLVQANPDNLDENSVELIISDMQGQHEGKMRGVPASYDWSQTPRVKLGNNPGELQALIGWGIVNEAAEGNPAANTRVELGEIHTYLLQKSNNRWLALQSSIPVGAAYREDFAGGINIPADIRQEPQGTISVTAGNGYNFHFWSRNRAGIDPNDVAGVFTTFRARLILDNPSQPDDRDIARYLALAGADYWTNVCSSSGERNADAAIGKAKYVTREWKYFNMTTASPEVLRNNPPPLE